MGEDQRLSELFTTKPKKKSQMPCGSPMAASAPSSATSSSSSGPVSSLADAVKPKVEAPRVASASSAASSSPSAPFWYRFRGAIATLLVVNVAVFGYALLNNKKSEVTEDFKPDNEAAVQTEADNHEVAFRAVAEARPILPVSEIDAVQLPEISEEQK